MAKSLVAALMLALLLCGCGGSSSSHPVTLASISVTPATLSIAPGTTAQFTATAHYSDGSVVDVTATTTWSSSNPAAATVNGQGLATGLSAGSSTLTATSAGVPGSATLAVVPLQSVEITPANPAVVIVGTTQRFSATGHLQNGDVQNLTSLVTWQSADPAIASIDASGLATGVGAGTVNLTASFGSVTSSPVSLSVASLQSITISPASPTIDAGAVQQFSASGTLSNATTRDVTSLVSWSSSSPTVASLNRSGLASALTPGSTTVSASYLGVAPDSTVLTVLGPSSITVTPANSTAAAGSTQQFTATGSFVSGATRDLTNLVTWSSSVAAAASISNANGSQGLATVGNGAGPTIIAATLGTGPQAVTGSTSLTVKTLTGLSVTPSPASVARGSSLQLTATGTFSDSSTQDLTSSAAWSSDATTIASVSNLSGTKGLVQGIAAGSASITATVGSLSASTALTVTPSGPASGNSAYLTNAGLNTLSVIDTTTNTVSTLIPVGTSPQSVALDTAGNRAYVTNNGAATVSVVDLTSNTVAATVPVGSGPWGVALLPATNRAYVVNKLSGSVSVLNTSTNAVVATIDVGASPERVAVNPTTNRIYVTNSGDSTISIISGATNQVISTVNVGAGPRDIALNTGGTLAYVVNGNANTVSVLNTATNLVTAAIPVGTNPQAIALNSSTNRAYVTNNGSSTMSVINTANNAVVDTVPVGSGPLGIAVRPATGRIYVVNNSANTVTVLSAATNGLIAGIQVGAGPKDIAVLP